MTTKPAINLGAHFHAQDGIGRHARSFAMVLKTYAQVSPLYFFRPPAQMHMEGYPLPKPRLWDLSAPAICLSTIDAQRKIPGNTQIAYTVWETTKIPEPYLRYLDSVDQIWLPTEWGKAIFVNCGIDASRIRVVPEGVDSDRFKPADVAVNNKVFRFLCIGKWEQRKGIDDLIKTFCREFKHQEPIELIIHGFNSSLPQLNIAAKIKQICHQQGQQNARIIISNPKPLGELIALMQQCDAFVLPTRAEGWGLPILEAMACGLPCIVTDYSGHRVFANHNNSYLIRVKTMCKAMDPAVFPSNMDWGEWAQPDLEHLAYLMRYVVDNPDAAKAKGLNARIDAMRYWRWDQAASIAMQYLQDDKLL